MSVTPNPKRRFWLAFAVSAMIAAGGATSGAAPPATIPPPRIELSIPFEKYRLGNGLEVILHEDHSLPFVAVNVWYHVGPSSEPKGRSGFAHLFEHLMFEGSRHVGTAFDTLMSSMGATNVNGTTSWDRTNYFETVPRQYLPQALWVESDRMGYLTDVLTQERLDVQRGVVENERRESYENAPYGPSSLAMLNALFPEGHPYHGAIIGSIEDIERASLDEVKAFHKQFYAPNDATLALAGDFDGKEAKALVEHYFGSLRPVARPAPASAAALPGPAIERRVVDEPVALSQIAMGWVTPPAYTRDDEVLEVTMALLAGGKATRLYRTLVVEQKLASDVSASLDSNALGSSALVSAVGASGKSEEQIERALRGVIDALAKDGPSAAELARAKRRVLRNALDDVQLLNGPGGENGRAGLLQRINQYLGDPGRVSEWLTAIESVTSDDVRNAVSHYLPSDRAVVVVTRPSAKSETNGAKP